MGSGARGAHGDGASNAEPENHHRRGDSAHHGIPCKKKKKIGHREQVRTGPQLCPTGAAGSGCPYRHVHFH